MSKYIQAKVGAHTSCYQQAALSMRKYIKPLLKTSGTCRSPLHKNLTEGESYRMNDLQYGKHKDVSVSVSTVTSQ